MDQAAVMQLAQMLQAQGGQQPPVAMPPQQGGLSEMMRQNFAGRGPGPVMENSHAMPPQAGQRPNDPLAPAYQGAAQGMVGMSPPAIGYGGGQAIGAMAQQPSPENAGALAMALLPGLRGGRLAQMLKGRFGGGEPAAAKPIDPSVDPIGWYLNERAQGRTPANEPLRALPPSAPEPVAPPVGSTEPIAQPWGAGNSGRASYPPVGSPERNNIRDAYRIAVTEAGGIENPSAVNKAIQGTFAEAGGRLPNLTSRIKETKKGEEAFAAANGKPPTTKADWDQVYKDKKTLGLAGMLSAGAVASGGNEAQAAEPDVHPKFKDRDTMGRFIPQD